jgi:hypothetical protein
MTDANNVDKTIIKLAEEYADKHECGDQAWGGAYDGFIAGYKAKIKMNSWIHVKDKLPEINTGFIAFVENKEVCNCHRYQNRTEDNSPIFYAETKQGLLICSLETVSHWMPLPKPPEDV